jgi:GxxExxY protein
MDERGSRDAREEVISRVLAAAVEVHRELGPGLLESAYESALCQELRQAGLRFEKQVEVPLLYKGLPLRTAFRADLVVECQLLLELKCVEKFEPSHVAQVLTYLRLLQLRRGFLLNFRRRLMRDGIKRVSL